MFSDISASPLDMRFLGTNGSVHEGELFLQLRTFVNNEYTI